MANNKTNRMLKFKLLRSGCDAEGDGALENRFAQFSHLFCQRFEIALHIQQSVHQVEREHWRTDCFPPLYSLQSDAKS